MLARSPGANCYTRAAVRLVELATELGCRLDGDGTIDVTRVASLDEAGPGDVTFLANPQYASKVATTRASAIIVDLAVAAAPCAMLRTESPYLAFARAVGLLMPAARPTPGISSLAAIDPTARLGPDVFVGPFVFVGPRSVIGARAIIHAHVAIGADVTIGPDALIHAQVSIREGVTLGARVVLQDGAVLGSDGFGFARRPDGTHEKIPQVGRVVIEDDVEIGAHSAVDRPAVGETRIAAGTKIDNLVQVAHGVKIGRGALLAAQAGIAGSSVLGDRVMMAGQSGVTGHVTVGADAIVSAKTAVTKDIPAGQQVAGVPAVPIAEWREAAVLVRRLPELRAMLAALEARLAALETRLK
jgi:UDP-3-O-[3-hydroxymyristoyl] glucosamine N-acyltransferase